MKYYMKNYKIEKVGYFTPYVKKTKKEIIISNILNKLGIIKYYPEGTGGYNIEKCLELYEKL